MDLDFPLPPFVDPPELIVLIGSVPSFPAWLGLWVSELEAQYIYIVRRTNLVSSYWLTVYALDCQRGILTF